MAPNFPGGHPPGGSGSYSFTEYDGGGRRRKRRRSGFLKGLRDLIVCALVAFGIVIVVFAAPLLMGFDPIDAADFVDAPGLAKIDAFVKGWRHKNGISEMTFSHNGKSITFTDDNGKLSGITAEGYDYGDSGDFESDLDEARRILKEWGLD